MRLCGGCKLLEALGLWLSAGWLKLDGKAPRLWLLYFQIDNQPWLSICGRSISATSKYYKFCNKIWIWE
jgi:hypothetical protein